MLKLDSNFLKSVQLMSGDSDFPAKLARFTRAMRKGRPFPPARSHEDFSVFGKRQPGLNFSTGSITSAGPSTSSTTAFNWQVFVNGGGNFQAPQAGTPIATPMQIARTIPYVYAASSAANGFNQIIQQTVLLTNGSPNSFAMDTWTGPDVVNDASPTLSAVKEFWLEVLTVAQGGGTTPTTGTTVGNGSQAWNGFLESTGTILVGGGGLWHSQDTTNAGVGVTSGDVLKMANGDGSHIATIRLTAIGYK